MWISRSWIASLWTIFIFGVCWTPRSFMPKGEETPDVMVIPNFDKLVHFALFAGFAFLWMRAGTIRTRWVILLGVGAAILSELVQLMPVINRDATWPDLAADLLGLVSGLLVFLLARRYLAGDRKAEIGPV